MVKFVVEVAHQFIVVSLQGVPSASGWDDNVPDQEEAEEERDHEAAVEMMSAHVEPSAAL